MKTERDTARIVHEWLREPAELDDRGLSRILDRLPDTPQRRHRWLWPFEWRPFGSGATRSAGTDEAIPKRRYKQMFTATNLAALTAALALTGSLALFAGSLGDPEPEPVPGNVFAGIHNAKHFTGRVSASSGSGDLETRADRTIERDWPSTFTNTMTDDRMSGTGAAMNYLEDIQIEGGRYLSHASHGELVNDLGAFDFTCTGAGATGTVEAVGESRAVITCWYEGKDLFRGMVAFTILSSSTPLSGVWDAEGWIWQGELPEIPPAR